MQRVLGAGAGQSSSKRPWKDRCTTLLSIKLRFALLKSDGSNYNVSIKLYSIRLYSISLSCAEEEQVARDRKRADSTASKLKKSLRLKVSRLSGKGTSCITFTESRAGRQDINVSNRVGKLMNDDEQLREELDKFCSALFEAVRAAEHRRDIGTRVRHCCLWAG